MYDDRVVIDKAFEEPLALSWKSLTGIDFRRPSNAQNGWLRFLVNGMAPRPMNLVEVMKEPTSIVLRASNLGANNAQNAYAYAMERLNAARSGEQSAFAQILAALGNRDDLEYRLVVRRQEG